ncbi:MAG: hypothetical protein JEZ10_08820 [Verrucomicrobia bacterium]|nr:hypothetical protein [Verrucomicrobiota bacterium]
MTPHVKAGGEGLVWLVVGIFWVIAQVAGNAARKKMPPRPLSENEENGNAPVDPFAELMRKLAGVQEFSIPAPPEPVEVQDAAWEPEEIEALPDIQPLQREILPPFIESPKIEAVNIRPTMKAFRNTLPAMRLPSMSLSFQPLEKSGKKVPTLGKTVNPDDPQSVRRAMLSHIVFSKPKALEGMK